MRLVYFGVPAKPWTYPSGGRAADEWVPAFAGTPVCGMANRISFNEDW
jgi:hypothetical protein